MLESWFQDHGSLVLLIGVASILMFLGTLVGLTAALVLLPPRHFVRDGEKPPLVHVENPALRLLYRILKNVVGVFFILAGLAMLILPGQGLLSLLVGMSLTDFPGKRRVIRGIVKRKAVLRSANWLRRKFGRSPLEAPK